MIAGKVWGTTQLLLRTPLIEMHLLNINPKSHCSLHMHQHKWNAFYVLDGELEIEVHKNNYQLIDVTSLGAGELMVVAPNEYHRFRTDYLNCECLEIYYPELLSEDIIRRDIGGTNDTSNNSSKA